MWPRSEGFLIILSGNANIPQDCCLSACKDRGLIFVCLGGKITELCSKKFEEGCCWWLSLSCHVFLTFSLSSFSHVPHIFAWDMGIKLLRFWAMCEPNELELPGFSVRNQKEYDKSIKLQTGEPNLAILLLTSSWPLHQISLRTFWKEEDQSIPFSWENTVEKDTFKNGYS